jgi:hypothetical protein
MASTHEGDIPNLDAISEIMEEHHINVESDDTRHRRARSVRAWIKWIWDRMID